MSRLRKGGKYKGGEFASDFKFGLATKTPFAFAGVIKKQQERAIEAVKQAKAKANKAASVAVAGGKDEMTESALEKARQGPNDAASKAAVDNRGKEDIVPSDTDYSREEVDSYFQRRKLAKEKAELEKAKADKEAGEKAKEEEEAGKKEEERESLSQGENIEGSFENEYDDGMSGKEKRAESKENKGQIRDAKKDAKAEAKDEFKAKKLAAKDLKGGDKRSAKKDARKDKRGDKKSIRKNKRSAKKSNRKAKRGK